jgi:hypothetical protein
MAVRPKLCASLSHCLVVNFLMGFAALNPSYEVV